MENRKAEKRYLIRDIVFIISGTVILALSMVFFLIPNRIAPGGVAGLALILFHSFGIPTGLTMLIINLPMFLLGFKLLGKKFAVRTLLAMVLFSFFTDLFSINLHLTALTTNTFLATLYGGLMVGTGLGLVFKGDATAGGVTILARILAEKKRIKTGSVMLFSDLIVISLAGVVFRNVELALWAFITIFISSQMIDLILTGRAFARVVQIVTTNPEGIGEHIIRDLGRTATILDGKGLFTGQGKAVILVAIDPSQVSVLTDIVKLHDSEAFMIIQDAREILGKGF